MKKNNGNLPHACPDPVPLTWLLSPSIRLNLHKEVRIWRGKKIWEELFGEINAVTTSSSSTQRARSNANFNFLCYKSKDKGLQSDHQKDPDRVPVVEHRRHFSNFCLGNPEGKRSQQAALVTRQIESWVCVGKKMCSSLTAGQKSVKLRDQDYNHWQEWWTQAKVTFNES